MRPRTTNEKGSRSLFCVICESTLREKAPGAFFDTLESGTVIGLEIRPGGVNHLTARHKNDVYGFRGHMGTKELARKAFCPVAGHGVAHLCTGGDAQSGRI